MQVVVVVVFGLPTLIPHPISGRPPFARPARRATVSLCSDLPDLDELWAAGAAPGLRCRALEAVEVRCRRRNRGAGSGGSGEGIDPMEAVHVIQSLESLEELGNQNSNFLKLHSIHLFPDEKSCNQCTTL